MLTACMTFARLSVAYVLRSEAIRTCACDDLMLCEGGGQPHATLLLVLSESTVPTRPCGRRKAVTAAVRVCIKR